jgi:multidrug efflux pump subunit AcrB
MQQEDVMIKPLLLGGIGGGVLVFLWGAVSWMALPWHEATLKKFSNEDVVSVTLQAYAPEPGVYVLPNAGGGTTAEEKNARMEEAQRAMAEGPVVFAAIQGPSTGMGKQMLQGLVSQILAAMLVTWMLLQAGVASFARRYALVLAFALAASLVGIVPGWIWWGFSNGYTAVGIADVLIGWAAGGAVMAWVTSTTTTA